MTAGAGAAPGGAIRLTHVAVRDVRNLAHVDLEPPPDGIAVIGENGHGKTNLLEAIYYLQILRSMRGAKDQDLVRFGEAGFHISAQLDTARGPREVRAGYDRATRRKRVRIDGADFPRLSDALGAVPSVVLAPADAVIVAGGPAERRRFLDIALALTSRRYLTALQGYRAALARRNAALRDAVRAGGMPDEDRIAVWEPALAEYGATILVERVAWTDRVSQEFTRLAAAIGERGEARLRYATRLEAGLGGRTTEVGGRRSEVEEQRSGSAGEADVRAALAEALAARRAHDVRRGLTHAGPHRDDMALTLDGRELRVFGSAGQQRTAAIVLRLLEADTLRACHEAAPLLLLDDPFAELDARRARRILELLGEAGMGQTIVAVPRAEDLPAALTSLERWRVVEGALSRVGTA